MLPAPLFRTLRSANKRCLAKFCWNFGVKGMLSLAEMCYALPCHALPLPRLNTYGTLPV